MRVLPCAIRLRTKSDWWRAGLSTLAGVVGILPLKSLYNCIMYSGYLGYDWRLRSEYESTKALRCSPMSAPRLEIFTQPACIREPTKTANKTTGWVSIANQWSFQSWTDRMRPGPPPGSSDVRVFGVAELWTGLLKCAAGPWWPLSSCSVCGIPLIHEAHQRRAELSSSLLLETAQDFICARRDTRLLQRDSDILWFWATQS